MLLISYMSDISSFKDLIKDASQEMKEDNQENIPATFLELVQYSQQGEFASKLDRVQRLGEVLNTAQGYEFVKKLFDAGLLTMTVLSATGLIPSLPNLPKDPNLQYSLPKFKSGLKQSSLGNTKVKGLLEGSDKLTERLELPGVGGYLAKILEILPADTPKKMKSIKYNLGNSVVKTKENLTGYYKERKRRVQDEVDKSKDPQLTGALSYIENLK
jgi:hypothetical protein